MTASRSFLTAGLCVAVVCVPGVSLYGAIPSCEKEIATLYPPALTPDLSACRPTDKSFKATTAASMSKFAKRLNGTWELSMRTVDGITADTRLLSSRLYFDLSSPESAKVTGVALLLEQPRDAGKNVMKKVSTGNRVESLALWDISVSQRDKMSLTLSMSENHPGSFDSTGKMINLANFAELQGVFTSLSSSANAEEWDRVILSDSALMRVSCRRGVVERYTKVSGQTPQVEGIPVKAFWQNRKRETMIAAGKE